VHVTRAGMTATRIGDYELVRALPATTAGIREFEAQHVLLPRTAHIHIAEPIAAPDLTRRTCLLETLRFPGVPRIYECGWTGARPWVALEAVVGPTLADMMLERTFGPAELLVLLRDLTAILEHAHTRGVAHGRLQPQSIVHHANAFYITDWGTRSGERRDDVRALAAMLALTMAPPIPAAIAALLARMTFAADAHAEALRLLDDDNLVEEVELELVELDDLLLAGGHS
jgi:serine/threonine protein kinase